ncbi:MAG: hypothetical protein J7K98_04275 [Candidatus Aenigmarchaeota archaeon]|nr:hypothetical protein [Candidatus Aenigmarchaeota archaeon]
MREEKQNLYLTYSLLHARMLAGLEMDISMPRQESYSTIRRRSSSKPSRDG